MASDCSRVLEIMHQGRADVLVLDFNTHNRAASHLASNLGCTEPRCRTLVLARSLEQMALANEAHADGVLMTPIDPSQVRAAICNLLSETPLRAGAHPPCSSPPPAHEALPNEND